MLHLISVSLGYYYHVLDEVQHISYFQMFLILKLRGQLMIGTFYQTLLPGIEADLQ